MTQLPGQSPINILRDASDRKVQEHGDIAADVAVVHRRS